MCIRLYGTGVAIILNQAPIGQPQLTPITGEQTIGVYSDQLRTEVGGQAVRQFTLVQAVSDLTEGAQPTLPPVGVDRLWADNQGNIHHLHSTGTDYELVDPNNATVLLLPVLLLGGDLSGQINAASINAAAVTAAKLAAGAASSNVGTLGGALNGTLPNPGLNPASVANVPLGGNLSGTVSNGGVDIKAGSYLWIENTGNVQLVRGAAAGGGSMTFLHMDANDLIHIADVNAIQFESYAGVANVHFFDGGGIALDRGYLYGGPNTATAPTFPLQVFQWDLGADVACGGGNVTLFTVTLPQTGYWFVDCTLTFSSPTSGCLFDAYCGAPSTYGAGATATVPAANAAVCVHMTALVQGTNQFSASCWTSFAGTLRAKTTYYNYQATNFRAFRYA